MKTKIIILFIILFIVACKHPKIYDFSPIGYYKTPYSLTTGAPRQGTLMPKTHGKIVLDKQYVSGLKSLFRFEYIWVLYVFDKENGWDSLVRPPKSHHRFGVFATRSPRRPNPIGLSLNKLDSIRENILYVSGIDAFDKTPVLDIKPFLPSIDYMKSLKTEKAEKFLGHHDEYFINTIQVKELVEGKN